MLGRETKMTIKQLQDLFIKNKAKELEFKGNCHDCGKDVLISAKLGENGGITISGGALYKVDDEEVSKRNTFLKCDSCFEKEPILQNYRNIEVWSRVVGYLRPVQQWNKGKAEEYKTRTTFKQEGMIEK